MQRLFSLLVYVVNWPMLGRAGGGLLQGAEWLERQASFAFLKLVQRRVQARLLGHNPTPPANLDRAIALLEALWQRPVARHR